MTSGATVVLLAAVSGNDQSWQGRAYYFTTCSINSDDRQPQPL